MTSFRTLQTPRQALDWTTHLNEKWPERAQVMAHIVAQIQALPFSEIHCLELCSGAGALATTLLTTLPTLTYTGLDSSSVLVQAAQQQLVPWSERADIVKTDLNQTAWLDSVPEQVQAIVSMQSLHDLGGETEVARMYHLAKTKLAAGGLFLNADLIVPEGTERTDNPGRRTISRHLELLAAEQYQQVSCTLQVGEFGCVVGYA